MFAVLLCLPVLLMLTSVCLARPLRYSASSQSCRSGQQLMPDLDALVLRSNPRVSATGRLIKGLYYSEVPKGLNAMAAFYMACDRLLERKPFLMMDFRSSQFFLDDNRDGCADATGTLPLPEVDPADFLPSVDGAEEFCNLDLISRRQLNKLVAIPPRRFREIMRLSFFVPGAQKAARGAPLQEEP
jgi:hypothetical protein